MSVAVTKHRRLAIGALVAVVGPGLLAGLSNDDPAGITTYSVLGADHGYQLLWVLLLSTIALVMFHTLAARMGVVSGQGLIGLVRQRYGVRVGGAVLTALVIANIATTCAEFAGIAAGFELFGTSRYVSVPAAALLVSALVLRGSFQRVERFLLMLSTVFLAYIASGILADPDWGAAAHGLLIPTMPIDREAVAIVTSHRHCSGSDWSARPCWQQPSCRCRPPTQYASTPGSNPPSMTRSERRKRSTSPLAPSLCSVRSSS